MTWVVVIEIFKTGFSNARTDIRQKTRKKYTPYSVYHASTLTVAIEITLTYSTWILYEQAILNQGHMMQFQESIKTCLNKFVDFKGRASRAEFWWFVLFLVLVNFIADAISDKLQGVIAILLLLPYLAVAVRRLHDIDKRWYYILWGLVPLIGFLIMLYFYLQKSNPMSNAFGPTPDTLEPPQIPHT